MLLCLKGIWPPGDVPGIPRRSSREKLLIAVLLDCLNVYTGDNAMEIKITFPGGKKVNAELNGIIIPTDQPVEDGGEGTAPSPFGYFLASLGTCAGIYVLSFCQQRGIDTEGMSLTQQMEFGTDQAGKKRLSRLTIDILLPSGFPEKYRNAIVKTAELCTVKKVISDPPEFVITASMP
jgi:putative redox protein